MESLRVAGIGEYFRVVLALKVAKLSSFKYNNKYVAMLGASVLI